MFDLKSALEILVVGGSRAYGIATATSDVDVKGVATPPLEYFLGFNSVFHQTDSPHEMESFIDFMTPEELKAIKAQKIEGTVYDIRKFMRLAADANPNILDVLFCREEEVRFLSPGGFLLRENRDLFLSAKAYFTFSGYAYAQLKKIELHRKWLLNPPTKPPTREEFDLSEKDSIPSNQLVAVRSAIKEKLDSWELDLGDLPPDRIIYIQDRIVNMLSEITLLLDDKSIENNKWLAAARSIGLDDNLIYVLQKEREYEKALNGWRSYQEHVLRRNPQRYALELLFGYDTKHGAHLVRLLRMGREILETGKVNVWRGDIDAEELLDIRNHGVWSFDTLIEWANTEEAKIKELYKTNSYSIPKIPDRKLLDQLCINIVNIQHNL